VRSSSGGELNSSQVSGDPNSPGCDAALVAAPPREFIETDVSVLSSAITSKRIDLQTASIRIHVEYSAYLVSTGLSLRYDPEKYKSCFNELQQRAAADLKAYNIQVVSNKISLIGFSGPRPGSFEISLLWNDAESPNTSRFCSVFSKLGTRR
jgi:hypothetical protein